VQNANKAEGVDPCPFYLINSLFPSSAVLSSVHTFSTLLFHIGLKLYKVINQIKFTKSSWHFI